VAYLGLDVRAKDSGKFRGQRKLTKHGDGEYRRLLYCAAVTACRMPGYFSARYQGLLARGLATTAAHVVIARKLAIIGFNLLRKGIEFDPAKLTSSDKRSRAAQPDPTM
jgi:transposase